MKPYSILSFSGRGAVMCPSHICRVRLTSTSNQSNLKFFWVESWLGRVRGESQELWSHWFASSSQCWIKWNL